MAGQWNCGNMRQQHAIMGDVHSLTIFIGISSAWPDGPVSSRSSQSGFPKLLISADFCLRPQSVGADPTSNFVRTKADRHSQNTEWQGFKKKTI
jgi:hypothetical protein